MQIFTTIQELQDYRAKQSTEIAFVPTMGALHEGHLDLVREAAQHAEQVWVSIFVNPLQFSPSEDLSKYPKTWEADCEQLKKLGVDILFAPSVEEIYRNFAAALKAEPEQYSKTLLKNSAIIPATADPTIANRLCGLTRAGHFDGVCSILHTLFSWVQPRIACFGEKDYQQLKVIQTMCEQRKEEFYQHLQIIPVATCREDSGLALSSRNKYLSPEQKQIAPKLYQELTKLKNKIPTLLQNAADTCCSREGEVDDYKEIEALLKTSKETLGSYGFTPEYLEIHWGRIFVAAKLGNTRLIDNVKLA